MSSSEEKLNSPPMKRRRSSILRRKSVVTVPFEHTQELTLREYIADTKREKNEWGDFYRHRKTQFKCSEDALAQVSAEPPTLTYEDIRQDLTEEDLKNIQHPDYDKICNDIDRFIGRAAMAKFKLDEVKSIINTDFLCLEARLNSLSKSICTFNDVAPLRLKDP